MAGNLVVGDEGKPIDIPVTDEDGVAVDISAATLLKVWFRSPEGVSASYTAVDKPGTPTTARYTLATGTEFVTDSIDRPGKWQAQIEYAFASGESGRSWPPITFDVGERFT